MRIRSVADASRYRRGGLRLRSLTDLRIVADDTATPRSDEAVSFLCPAQLPGVTILNARPSSRLWVVYHETYTVCTIFDQLSDWSYRGRRYRSGPGSLMVMEPGEIHVTNALSGPCTFSVVLLDPDLLADAGEAVGIGPTPHLDPGRALDPELWSAFARFHRMMGDPATTSLHRQTVLADAVRLLLGRASATSAAPRGFGSRQAVERARAYIHDNLDRDIHLDELASIADVSPWYLSREFARWVGVPQHRYQILARVAQARRLIDEGLDLSAIAGQVGFTDQSHLTRWFKRMWGTTPGAYARSIRWQVTPAVPPAIARPPR